MYFFFHSNISSTAHTVDASDVSAIQQTGAALLQASKEHQQSHGWPAGTRNWGIPTIQD